MTPLLTALVLGLGQFPHSTVPSTYSGNATARNGTCNKLALEGAASTTNSADDTAIGATIAIVASVISNVGVNVQKAAHNRNDARAKADRQPFTKMPIWWVGMGGVIAGSLGDFVALGFATQALVAALVETGADSGLE